VAAIGTMASGIGHEINSPLYVIMGRAEAIRDEKDISACTSMPRISSSTPNIFLHREESFGIRPPTSQHELVEIDVHEKLAEALAMGETFTAGRNELKFVRTLRQYQDSCQAGRYPTSFFNIIRNGIQAMAGRRAFWR